MFNLREGFQVLEGDSDLQIDEERDNWDRVGILAIHGYSFYPLSLHIE
jgi:hypothetical protein